MLSTTNFGSNIPNLIQIHTSLYLGMTFVPRNLRSFEYILPPSRLLMWMHERNAIKLHVQFFLRMKI